MALVLIVETDPLLSLVLQQEYLRQGHQVLIARGPREALRLAESYPLDLVVVNAALPQSGAAEIYCRLKALTGKARVLFYSIQLHISDELPCSGQGAARQGEGNLSLGELALRSAPLLRHEGAPSAPSSPDHLVVGTLILHSHNLTAERNGRKCTLTPTECELLRYLMLHANEPCSASRLLQHVWGYPPGVGSTDLVRTHMRNLRNKLEERPTRPTLLRTVRHRGYMLYANGDETEEDEDLKVEQAIDRRRSGQWEAEHDALGLPAVALAGSATYT